MQLINSRPKPTLRLALAAELEAGPMPSLAEVARAAEADCTENDIWYHLLSAGTLHCMNMIGTVEYLSMPVPR